MFHLLHTYVIIIIYLNFILGLLHYITYCITFKSHLLLHYLQFNTILI